jgi:hypothetical protein
MDVTLTFLKYDDRIANGYPIPHIKISGHTDHLFTPQIQYEVLDQPFLCEVSLIDKRFTCMIICPSRQQCSPSELHI